MASAVKKQRAMAEQAGAHLTFAIFTIQEPFA